MVTYHQGLRPGSGTFGGRRRRGAVGGAIGALTGGVGRIVGPALKSGGQAVGRGIAKLVSKGATPAAGSRCGGVAEGRGWRWRWRRWRRWTCSSEA